MCGLWIWPEPNSQFFVCGIWIVLCSVQSASGAMHGGKRLFFSPLHTKVVCIYSGEGIIWMSWVTKPSSEAMPAHWNQLCHSGLKLGEGESVPTWTGSWKKCIYDILCCTSCPASSVEPVTHCIYANINLPTAASLIPVNTGFFSFSRLLSLAETLDQEQGLSQSQYLILCVGMSCSEHEWTRFSLKSHKPSCTHTVQKSWGRGKESDTASLCPALKMNAKSVLIPCVLPTLS